jgi:hypothetical protein
MITIHHEIIMETTQELHRDMRMSGKQYGNMMLTMWKHHENVKTKYEKLF